MQYYFVMYNECPVLIRALFFKLLPAFFGVFITTALAVEYLTLKLRITPLKQ